MFALPISSSLLVSPAADEIFKNIKGSLFRGDVSFLATMRMLLHSRLPEEDVATVEYRSTDFDYIRLDDKENLLNHVFGSLGSTEKNIVFIADVGSLSDSDRKEFASYLKDVNQISGMTAEPAVEAFFNQLMISHVWIDFETCRTLILTDRMSVAKWHAIASLTSRYFKKYFSDTPLSEEERQIPLALCNEKNADKFKSLMTQYAQQFDFRSAGIRTALAGYENRNLKTRLSRLDEQISAKIGEIESMNDRYVRAVRTKRDLEESRAALSLGIKEDKNELMEYFLRNKNLFLDNISDNGNITFYVRTAFANFNSDIMENILANPDRADRVSMYQHGSMNFHDRDLLYKAIMVDRTVRVWMFGKFTMGLEADTMVRAHSDVSKPDDMMDACPNPHLQLHACMGDNQRAAIDAVVSGDYVLAVEQCIGAVASVNLNETVTSGPWMEDLLSDKHGRFFENEEGQMMNCTEIVEYLKNKEGNK